MNPISSRLESLVAWRAEQLELERRLAASGDAIAADADALSALIEKGAPGASLPRLSGHAPEDLRDLFAYLAQLGKAQ